MCHIISVQKYHSVGVGVVFVGCFESMIVVMDFLPNVFLLLILHLQLTSSSPIVHKAPSTDMQSFDTVYSLDDNLPANDDMDDNLPANDDMDDALGTNGFIFDVMRQVEDEMRQDDREKYDGILEGINIEEKKQVHDNNMSGIAKEGEASTTENGKLEEVIEKKSGGSNAFLGGIPGCRSDGWECKEGEYGVEICWPSPKCEVAG